MIKDSYKGKPKSNVTQVAAKQKVASEYYGVTAEKHGMNNNKRDGALMA